LYRVAELIHAAKEFKAWYPFSSWISGFFM